MRPELNGSPYNYVHYRVPLSHNSHFWSPPSRAVTKPHFSHWVPLSRSTLFVVGAVELLTQTLLQRCPLHQLVSVRRSRLGIEYHGPALDCPLEFWEAHSGGCGPYKPRRAPKPLTIVVQRLCNDRPLHPIP